MNSVFTESYAAYLFIILAIAMMVCGFIFANRGGRWLFYLAALGWTMAGFYCFSVQASLTAFVHFLGVFCMIAVLGCIMMPTITSRMMNPKKKEEPHIETSEEYREKLRAMRYGSMVTYDKTGHKVQGW